MFRIKLSCIFNPLLWGHTRVLGKKTSTDFLSLVTYFHTQNSLHCRHRQSALHISGDRAQTVFAVLSPYMDISKTMQNLGELEYNISLRKMNLDIKKLFSLWKELEELSFRKKELEKERMDIASAMKALSQKGKNKSQEFSDMKLQGREVREKLKPLVKEVLDLEDSVILRYLEVPNALNPSVSENDKILLSMFSKPCFEYEIKRHELLGKLNKDLEFIDCSPTAYYLKNKLAMLELACGQYFSYVFRTHGYVRQSNPDFAKGVVVEGSGINVCRIEQETFVLTSHNSDDDPSPKYLIGGASLQAFSSYFTRQIVDNVDCLPQKLITVGRNYSPSSDNGSGLFSSWQTVAVDGFIMFEHSSAAQDAMINETLMALTQCFTQLKIHFQVKQYAAHNLLPEESAAIGFLMLSPATETYREIARISVFGNFISKRLLMLKRLRKDSASFLSMIHVRVCNVTHLLACLMENTQTKSGLYDIPDVLRKFMHM